ncbi:hypothetical protein PAXRUDRAFT_822428 [Paxillus rubicundulus Ve08.2h10]|uniref:Uncharacterized protein n=1 Tax=Paxillus rubicundulus Ve08.2h10 TaxID=930991 RepID=A0A0D0ECP8_9AGAM|nr:hypothetical protein PAXRUDRAFT_822428 [Paxillus rubicundulus Ve08.2h10]
MRLAAAPYPNRSIAVQNRSETQHAWMQAQHLLQNQDKMMIYDTREEKSGCASHVYIMQLETTTGPKWSRHEDAM